MMRVEALKRGTARPSFATTEGVPSREKFDYWHDVVCRNLVDLDYRLIGKGPFEATYTGSRLDALNMSRIQASPHQASRSSAGIARNDSESLVFNFVLAGALTSEQDGRRTRLKVGEGAFCDARRPYRLESDEPFTIACLQMPRHLVESRISGLHRLSGFNLCERGELGPLVFAYLSRLIERAPMIEGPTAAKVCQNFSDLVVSTLADLVESSLPPLTEYRSLALMRVKDVVERNLSNRRLGPDMVAAELRLSPRYINNLLEAEETSLSRYIWQRRIERSAEQLLDQGLRGRSISSIALNNGFNDLSHFSKAFRERFGQSPREYRRLRRDS
jgi:AraC family transcriptional regulator, positive regulator of tynA and feaB